MSYISDILLGRITKASGYEGAVTVRLEKIFSENVPQMESVFLEIEGKAVPFFVSYYEYAGDGKLKLMFEGYDSVDKILEFTGCRVFLTTYIAGDNLNNDLKDFKGYKVFTQDDILLGSITEVISNPGQMLLNVFSTGNKDILIPFHEHFIVSIDKTDKIIVMDIPQGLIEIN